MNKFDLETQWKLYLERMDLKEENLHPMQLQETKRAFMGAMGQMLMICNDDLDSFKNPVTGEAVVYMIDQVTDYFQKEIQKHQQELNKELIIFPNIRSHDKK